MEFKALKMKCGFICARNACISSSTILLLSAVLFLSILLTPAMRIRTSVYMLPATHSEASIINQYVCQKGGLMVNDNTAGDVLQSLLLLFAQTRNRYAPLPIASRFTEPSFVTTVSVCFPSSTYLYNNPPPSPNAMPV